MIFPGFHHFEKEKLTDDVSTLLSSWGNGCCIVYWRKMVTRWTCICSRNHQRICTLSDVFLLLHVWSEAQTQRVYLVEKAHHAIAAHSVLISDCTFFSQYFDEMLRLSSNIFVAVTWPKPFLPCSFWRLLSKGLYKEKDILICIDDAIINAKDQIKPNRQKKFDWNLSYSLKFSYISIGFKFISYW